MNFGSEFWPVNGNRNGTNQIWVALLHSLATQVPMSARMGFGRQDLQASFRAARRVNQKE
jgi:hypothetical protein